MVTTPVLEAQEPYQMERSHGRDVPAGQRNMRHMREIRVLPWSEGSHPESGDPHASGVSR